MLIGTGGYTERELRVKLGWLMAVKKILFGFNYAVWTAGCVAACIGIWFRIERDFKTLLQRINEADISIDSNVIYLGANLLISTGVIVAFVGLLGSISVTKESETFLFIYSILNFCVFGLYIGVAVWGFVRIDYLKGVVSDAMRELFNKALSENLSAAKYAVNEIQTQLQCCGNVGPSEYAGDIPPACSSYVVGCNQSFYDFYWRHILLMSILGISFAVLQLICITITVYFANEVRIARRMVNAWSRKAALADEQSSRNLIK